MFSGLQFVQFEEEWSGVGQRQRLFLRAITEWVRFVKKLRRQTRVRNSVF